MASIYNKTITLCIDNHTLSKIKREAKDNYRKMSEQIRMLIHKGLTLSEIGEPIENIKEKVKKYNDLNKHFKLDEINV